MSELATPFSLDGRLIRPDALPRVMRLVACTAYRLSTPLTLHVATLQHRHLTLRVTWSSTQADPRLRPGVLATITWQGAPILADGVLHIGGLEPVLRPDDHTNLFDTVLPQWPVPRDLVERGRTLMQRLPRRFRHLFNAIFWDDLRFLRYLTGPRNLQVPAPDLNGNLRHSLDVAERALAWRAGSIPVFPALLILGGLLHDAGKADCYAPHADEDRFVAVTSGGGVSPRATVLRWLEQAQTTSQPDLPPPHARALVDLLSGRVWDGDHPGASAPPRPEVSLVALADAEVHAEEAAAASPVQAGTPANRPRQNFTPVLVPPTGGRYA